MAAAGNIRSCAIKCLAEWQNLYLPTWRNKRDFWNGSSEASGFIGCSTEGGRLKVRGVVKAIQLYGCQERPKPQNKSNQTKQTKKTYSFSEFWDFFFFADNVCFWAWKLYFVSTFQTKSGVLTFTVSKWDCVKEVFEDSLFSTNRNNKFSSNCKTFKVKYVRLH